MDDNKFKMTSPLFLYTVGHVDSFLPINIDNF